MAAPASRFGSGVVPGDRSAGDDARAVQRWLFVPLFSAIFLQRFAVPIGEQGIAVNLLVTWVALLVLLVRGALVIDTLRVALLLLFLTAIWVSTLYNSGHVSLPSIALLLTVHFSFVFSLRSPAGAFEACARWFRGMALVCACCGILQYLGQFVVGPRHLFSFQGLLPSEILIRGFNTVIQTSYMSGIYKSNGFFFVEPSVFSQCMAIAVVFEVLFFRSPVRIVIYAAALTLSYSGTGLIVLALLLPALLVYRRAYGIIAALLVFGLFAYALGDLWHMDALLQRTGELGESNTSATARFLSGIRLISTFQLSSLQDVLFGMGAGEFPRYQPMVSYEINDPPWAKVMFEYGLVGSIPFWIFFFVLIYRRAPWLWVSTTLAVGFITFGGTFMDPRMAVYILMFCTLPKNIARLDGKP